MQLKRHSVIFLSVLFFASTCVLASQVTEPDPLPANVVEVDDVTGPGSENKQLVEEQVFDIDVLIERVKETNAIGFITKLSLKNQLDDLLEHAEDVNENPTAEDVEQIEAEFDGLLLKTVTLLNNGEDFTLAEDIFQARDQLWESIMENKT